MPQSRGNFRCEKPPSFKALFRKELALPFLVAFFLFSLEANSQEPVCDEVPLTLDVNGIGSMELFSLLCGEEVYVSVPDLFDFLKIRNVPGNNYDSVTGYILNQNDTFTIDALQNTMVYGGKTIELAEGDIRTSATNLYLKAHYFGEIFGLEISSSIRSMSIAVDPNFELPSLRAAKREKLRENVQRLKRGTIAADTSIARETPFFNMGVADWSLTSSQSTNGHHYNRLNLGLGGLLAGGEFTSNLNYNSNQPFSSRNQFYRWRYVDNEHDFVRQTAIGRINPRSTTTLYDPVVGMQLTNAPTYLKKSFGTYQLSDYTEPDWMVELYINNVLVDFVQADASGFFSFDVPLMYGSTAIELRYYGPYGEEEIVDQHFSIPFVFLPKNEFEYNVSAGVVEDGENSVFAQAAMNYGLTRGISLGAGVEYLSSLEEHPVMPFVNAAVRLPRNMLLSGKYTHQVGFEGDFSFTSPSNVRLELRYSKYHEGQQAVRFSYLEERELELSVPVRLGEFRGTSRFSFRQNIMRSGSFFNPQWFLSARAFGLNFNFSTTGYLNEYSDPLVYSRLSSSIRLPRGVTFTPQVQFEYNENKLTSLRGELRKRVFKSGYLRTSYEHNFKMDQYYLTVGLTFELGFSRVGLSGNTNRNESILTETASGSLLFDPRLGHFQTSNRTSLDKGSVKFIAFLDVNGNGQREATEPLVKGMEVRSLHGGQREETQDGATLFSGMEPYIDHHFTINTDRLNRIAWRVKNKTVNVELNPNQIKLVEIPVSVEGEVGGFVYDAEGAGFGGIRVNILNGEGVLVKQLISEPDGFFSYLGLQSGAYTAQVDREQLQRLELESNKDRRFEIRNTEEGDLVDNLEFVVQKNSVASQVAEATLLDSQTNPDSAELASQEESESELEEEAANVSEKESDLANGEEGANVSEKELDLANGKEGDTVSNQNSASIFEEEAATVSRKESEAVLKEEGTITSEEESEPGFKKNGDKGSQVEFETPNKEEETIALEEVSGLTVGKEKLQESDLANGEEGATASNQNPASIFEEEATPVSGEETELLHEEVPATGSVENLPKKQATKEGRGASLQFKVQLAASRTALNLQDSLPGTLQVESHWHDGYHKYTTGTYSSFAVANKVKNALRTQGFPEAFVVPFHNDSRLNPWQAEGRVLLQHDGLTGIGGIPIEIRDGAGRKVEAALSEADGGFRVPGLVPGSYSAALNPNQLEHSGMRAKQSILHFSITKDAGVSLEKLEFILLEGDQRNASGSTESRQDRLPQEEPEAAPTPETSADKITETSAAETPDTSAVQGRESSTDQTPETAEVQTRETSAAETPDTSAVQGRESSTDRTPETAAGKKQKTAAGQTHETLGAKQVVDSTQHMVFKVQVLASKPRLSVNHRLLKGLQGVERHAHDGLFKYTWGEKTTLEEIRQVKAQLIERGFTDAFIVPFYKGKRFDLQEASGLVQMATEEGLQPLEGVKISFLDANGYFLTTVATGRNGRFGFLGLRPGAYRAQLDQDQLKLLGLQALKDSLVFHIGREAAGDEHLDFVLQKSKDLTEAEMVPTDGSVPDDASTPADASNSADASTSLDTSASPDASTSVDASNPDDASVPAGSSTPADASQDDLSNCNLVFRVQVAASNVRLSRNHPALRQKQGLDMHVHQGQYKYTFGKTCSLSEALEIQDQLQLEGFVEAFVVAFRNQKRLSLEELKEIKEQEELKELNELEDQKK